MTVSQEIACPLCGAEGASIELLTTDTRRLRCKNCGRHRITASARAAAASINRETRARLAHLVARMPVDTVVRSEEVEHARTGAPLPNPLERLDSLVVLMATTIEPGTCLREHPANLQARLGCESTDAVSWVLSQAKAEGLTTDQAGQWGPSLTARGWTRFRELERDGHGSRRAFMAMRFGDEQLARVFSDFMQPAVAQAGFELRTVAGPHQEAGSIDNRMRVEIRTSRFLVCDLTHGNRGAYWEAGFAEGLGRPVFYTCRRDVLQDRTHEHHPHFDTAHQLILDWAEGETLAADMQRLKDAIRATLPAEAKMED